VPSTGRFAPGVIGFLDCQAQTLGAGGYQALAASGSTVSLLLTAMLTLFVAFVGYRMLFGQVPTVREGVLAFVKIGIVLALATSWPAYQRVIYDVVLHEPAELVAEIGAPAGLPGSGGGLIDRLDGVDQAFDALALYGVGQPPEVQNGQPEPQIAPPLFSGFDTFALGASRVTFLAGAISAFALLRIAAGLLLALGPLFIAFLLFEGTRGLFEGWLRALIGITLGALATAVVLGIELALLEPWLSDLLARRAAGLAIIGAPAQLLAISAIFAIVLAAMLLIAARIALAWRLPIPWPVIPTSLSAFAPGDRQVPASTAFGAPIETRSRAAVIADAISSTERREALASGYRSDFGPSQLPSQASRARDTGMTMTARTPLGHSFPRRVGTRVSASAGKRDRPV
jgi:type IV secretion system protein VirB6